MFIPTIFRKSIYDGKASHNGNQEQITVLNPAPGRSLQKFCEKRNKLTIMCLGTTLSSMDMKTIQMWASRLNIDNHISQCRCDVNTRSNVSQGFCQQIRLAHICTESDQLKTKSNPGKFLRKSSFSDF